MCKCVSVLLRPDLYLRIFASSQWERRSHERVKAASKYNYFKSISSQVKQLTRGVFVVNAQTYIVHAADRGARVPSISSMMEKHSQSNVHRTTAYDSIGRQENIVAFTNYVLLC